MIYLLVGYMWLFVHRPFEVWPWLGELRIERVYMLITIAYWALFATKTWTSNRVNWGVGLFAASMGLSTFFSPYTDFGSVFVQDWFKVAVFYVLVLTSVASERDLKTLILGFVGVIALYELHSLYEYFNGRGVYRMGTWRMIGVDATMSDPNTFGATINYALPMLLPVAALAKRPWHHLGILGLLALSCGCILLTGSRTAFVGLGFQMVVLGLASRHRWKIIPLLLVLPPIVWIALPQDRRERYWTIIDPSHGPANAQSSAHGRVVGFFNGIDLWKSHPLFGVGPACHGAAVGHGFRSHNLYGEILGNNGSFGALAILCLICGFFWNFAEATRLRAHIPWDPGARFLYAVAGAVAFTCVLLLLLGWGGHNLLRYQWLWYAAFQAITLHFLRRRTVTAYEQPQGDGMGADPSLNCGDWTASPDASNWGGLSG